ncbi:hypothetical protein Tco_0533184, partial [Tanacetum coccineum]
MLLTWSMSYINVVSNDVLIQFGFPTVDNILFGSVLDFGFPPLVDATGTVYIETDGSTVLKSDQVSHEAVAKEAPSSYADKLIPMSMTKVNLRELDANMPQDADFDIWVPLASVNEVNDKIKN